MPKVPVPCRKRLASTLASYAEDPKVRDASPPIAAFSMSRLHLVAHATVRHSGLPSGIIEV